MSLDQSLVPEDEPFGHIGYYSKLERAWMRMPWGTSLVRRRTARYDAASSILYEPVEYEHPSIISQFSGSLPDKSEISRYFRTFVRGEFGTGESTRNKPSVLTPSVMELGSVGVQTVGEYLAHCESDFVYRGLVDRLVSKHGDNMVDLVYEILCSSDLGNKRNRQNVDIETFRSALNAQISRRDRLLFLLPAFPFKDQNRLRTFSGASTVDMGEIALLARLHALALAIYQVHPFGADVVVVSDGILYAPIFGVDNVQAQRYREQLRAFRNMLNIQGTVSILDLSELISHLRSPDGSPSAFDTLVQRASDVISEFSLRDDDAGHTFAVLKRGMKWNLNTRSSLAGLSDSDAWDVLTEMRADGIPRPLKGIWAEIDAAAGRAAVLYGAYNVALKHFDILSMLFPDSLRATVHPKENQFAVPRTGTVYPWNGVGFLHQGPLESGDVETVQFHELAPGPVGLVRFDLTGEPLYFRNIP